MKKIIFQILFFCCVILSLCACTSNMEYTDADVTAVEKLYEPTDGKAVTLQSSATAALYFEWSPARGEDGAAPLYEVLFDKTDGDFSSPLYVVTADDNGVRNYATITHKTLNKIGTLAGLQNGETGALKWCVRSSRGINTKLSLAYNTVTITRLIGFDEIPTQLFVTGEGTECGTQISNAIACASPSSDMFEVFVRLEKGKKYVFASNNNDATTPSYYYISGTQIKEGDTGSTVDETGVYRIKLDFSIASVVSMKRITSVGMFFCSSNEVTIDLPYAGNGVWQGEGKVEFSQESWGRDQRYKFHMYYSDGSKTVWGTLNDTDSNPGSASKDDPYFYITETADNQWDQKWKFNNDFDGAADGYNPGAITRLSLIFNVEHYTHKVELVN